MKQTILRIGKMMFFLSLIAVYGFNLETKYYVTAWHNGPENREVRPYVNGDTVSSDAGDRFDGLMNSYVDLQINTPTCRGLARLAGLGWMEMDIPVNKKHKINFSAQQLFHPRIQLAILPPILFSRKKEVDLIQPRHIYAPSDTTKPGQIFLPSSLLIAGAQLMQKGVTVRLFDQNIQPYENTGNDIGMNILGAPYLPQVIEILTRHDFQEKNIILGGQVVRGLAPLEFAKLFPRVHSFATTENISEWSHPENVRLYPMYNLIPDKIMREYLSHEFSFYLSQGCKYECKFCAAVHTQGKERRIAETYRDLRMVIDDLAYLFVRADTLGISKLQFYLSNLDVFQTPKKLHEFAGAIIHLKKINPGMEVKMRGLATTDSFLRCAKNYPQTVELLREAGYTTTGFGIDGATPSVWEGIGKHHNFSHNGDPALQSIEAIAVSRKFGITPELLMVFGHPGIDTEETLKLSVSFTKEMISEFKAIPRPHIAKNLIPGNEHWAEATYEEKRVFFENPWMFQQLDFCALATKYTHGSEAFADMVNEHYLQICTIPGNTTIPVYPIEPTGENGKVLSEDVTLMRSKNEGRYDH